MIYPEIQYNPSTIYSFLLVAGYLKVDFVYPQYDGFIMCDVSIPNREVAIVFKKAIAKRERSLDDSDRIPHAAL